MRTISLVSTKGGCGKTALSCALAVRFDAVLLDLDPQASACRWRDRRDDKEPVVTDVAPARLRPTLDALAKQGVDVVVIDTPPRSETAALEAVRVADLVVVPCRAQIVDVETVSNTLALLTLARSPLAVAVLVAVPPRGQRADQARSAIAEMGLRVCPHTIGHRAAWGDAAALGLAVQEHVPAGRGPPTSSARWPTGYAGSAISRICWRARDAEEA